MDEFATYLIMYGGVKMPPLYIGSTSTKKILKGYMGSITSKLYKQTYQEELKSQPHLFGIFIIRTFNTRKEAMQYELYLQKLYCVVKSDLYINMAYASPNGFFGRDVTGPNNPRYGTRCPQHVKESIRQTNKGKRLALKKDTGKIVKIDVKDFNYNDYESIRGGLSEESKQKISTTTKNNMKKLVESNRHWFQTDEHKKIVSESKRGVERDTETKQKISNTRKEKYSRPWLYQYTPHRDYKKIFIVVDWYINNWVKCSKKLIIEYFKLCENVELDTHTANWLYKRVLANKQRRIRLIEQYNLYKQEVLNED